ncbi:3-dehydroquinate dehydratase-1 [Caldalkalibacillus uzonensis]|uniref:3-dehydroquinate dehydratase n=1 Tax=Caldalkalibacillus uzonensis TaxID=353224 RepID=A0ABU0CPS1_9BACI|nr:type I 3-dehydroquinate dehydratase [Caldalkalibacillus uzonensis]MDQ0338396.1 3-dehydroquinate dehydratase-1 [Caldalkalibacillus uzonensis]
MKELLNENELPCICTPLTGKNKAEIISELVTIVPKNPDLIEWRVDFFNDIDQLDEVFSTLQEIYNHSNGIPLLFTIRSQAEGGQEIPLLEDERVELLCKVCESDFIDMIDFEVSNNPEHIKRLRDVSNKHLKKLVLSYHNFECTPKKTEIFKHLLMMQFYGADVAKAAVMPNSQEDVITLLEVTKEAKETLTIPVVTMSMGELGIVSRIFGWYYGSAITFAVGDKSSAPGQIPIETLQQIIRMVKDSIGYD